MKLVPPYIGQRSQITISERFRQDIVIVVNVVSVQDLMLFLSDGAQFLSQVDTLLTSDLGGLITIHELTF